MTFDSVEQLAGAVEQWCREHRVAPANGQASVEISPRNVRYYRTLGLLDGPADGVRGSYGEKHFLQLVAIRLLQAQGLPLRRIQHLLMGRSLDDLRRVQRDGLRELTAAAARAPGLALAGAFDGEAWQLAAVDDEWLLVSRRGRAATAEQLQAIRAILAGPAHAARLLTTRN